MSVARRAVKDTIKKTLTYTAEIIMAIVLLVIVCLPIVFVVPMWLQHILLGVPRTNLLLDPVLWFGLDGAFWVTLGLGLVGITLGFLFVSRSEAGAPDEDEEEEQPGRDEIIVDSVLEEIEEAEEDEEEEESDFSEEES